MRGRCFNGRSGATSFLGLHGVTFFGCSGRGEHVDSRLEDKLQWLGETPNEDESQLPNEKGEPSTKFARRIFLLFNCLIGVRSPLVFLGSELRIMVENIFETLLFCRRRLCRNVGSGVRVLVSAMELSAGDKSASGIFGEVCVLSSRILNMN